MEKWTEHVELLARDAGFDTDLGAIVAPAVCQDGDLMDIRHLLELFAQAVARDCAAVCGEHAKMATCRIGAEWSGSCEQAISARFGLGGETC